MHDSIIEVYGLGDAVKFQRERLRQRLPGRDAFGQVDHPDPKAAQISDELRGSIGCATPADLKLLWKFHPRCVELLDKPHRRDQHISQVTLDIHDGHAIREGRKIRAERYMSLDE